MSAFLGSKPASKKGKPQAPEAPPVEEAVIEEGISVQTVAAIVAAVQAENGGLEVKYVAIRRGGAFQSPWSSSSTMDIIHTRQQYL